MVEDSKNGSGFKNGDVVTCHAPATWYWPKPEKTWQENTEFAITVISKSGAEVAIPLSELEPV
jgi:hypothetical protein